MYKKFILFFLCAIIFFGLGFALGILYKKSDNKKNTNNIINNNDTFQAGWEAAKKRLYHNDPSETANNSKMTRTVVIGSIEKIEKEKITVKIEPLEILASPDLDYRIISMNDKTDILESIKKNPGDYKVELEKFFSENPQYKNAADAPVPNIYYEAKSNISEFKTGQLVKISSLNDITNEKQFIASKIIILSK